jgi:hypothetical protein
VLNSCDDCYIAMQYPDLTKKTYDSGCAYCAARYKSNGGKSSITKDWPLVEADQVRRLMAEATFIDPTLRRKK